MPEKSRNWTIMAELLEVEHAKKNQELDLKQAVVRVISALSAQAEREEPSTDKRTSEETV